MASKWSDILYLYPRQHLFKDRELAEYIWWIVNEKNLPLSPFRFQMYLLFTFLYYLDKKGLLILSPLTFRIGRRSPYSFLLYLPYHYYYYKDQEWIFKPKNKKTPKKQLAPENHEHIWPIREYIEWAIDFVNQWEENEFNDLIKSYFPQYYQNGKRIPKKELNGMKFFPNELLLQMFHKITNKNNQKRERFASFC